MLRGLALTGTAPAPDSSFNSTAAILDTTIPDYGSAARETYYDRLLALAEMAQYHVGWSGGNTIALLFPGPYGSILTTFAINDVVWLALVTPHGRSGSPTATQSLLTIHDEEGDGTSHGMRLGRVLNMPVSKNIMSALVTGAADGATNPRASMTYVHLPSDWSPIVDPRAPFDFRDDFLGASIDTGVWTRVESTAGNVDPMPHSGLHSRDAAAAAGCSNARPSGAGCCRLLPATRRCRPAPRPRACGRGPASTGGVRPRSSSAPMCRNSA
jgi:hypothetical protein